MQTTHSISGYSLPLNIIFVVLNFAGITFTTIGFHDSFEANKMLFTTIGLTLLAFSVVALIFFKGKLMMATISRILVGSLFLVSGLIKANDPRGFSYKLEEYFEDGALAYRIKDWFGAPGFSFENFIQYALLISIVICILEIVLGVLVIIGGKMRFVSWLLILLMLFFTFLTWHTSTCDPKKMFVDRDTYSMNSYHAETKIAAAKTNKDIKIISKTADEVVVDEMKQTKCVTDCGCFGDAMKGSIGRSLTPKESLWKDLILLYLVTWIFVAQGQIKPNNIRQNWIFVPLSFLLVSGLSWVFDWYYPILFVIIGILGALWINSWRNRFIGNYLGASLWLILLCIGFVWYVLTYDPLRDYRPYAIGNYLPNLTKNGKPGKYESLLVYKNIHSGEIQEFEASSREYMESKIWEKTNDWKYVKMDTKEIVPTQLPSIDTAQFNPSRSVKFLSDDELELAFIQNQLTHLKIEGYRLEDMHSKEKLLIPAIEYHEESYPKDTYKITDTLDVDNPELTDVSIRDFIFQAPELLVVFSNNLKQMNLDHLEEIKDLLNHAKKAAVPMIMVTSASDAEIQYFKKKNQLNIPVFINDGTELKVVSRVNPSLMVLKNGWVKGKYSGNSLPTFKWIQTNLWSK